MTPSAVSWILAFGVLAVVKQDVCTLGKSNDLLQLLRRGVVHLVVADVDK
jgi:hypothetical protein